MINAYHIENIITAVLFKHNSFLCVIDSIQIRYTMNDNVFMFIVQLTKQLRGIQQFQFL